VPPSRAPRFPRRRECRLFLRLFRDPATARRSARRCPMRNRETAAFPRSCRARDPRKVLGRSLRVHDSASGSRTRSARLPESHEQAAVGAAPSKPKIATYGPCRNPIDSAPSSGRKLTTKPNSAHQATRNRVPPFGKPAVERRSQQRGENSNLIGQRHQNDLVIIDNGGVPQRPVQHRQNSPQARDHPERRPQQCE
jgi:hypothetical protein